MDVRDARRILLCLRWGIGDLVMELPMLEALRRHAPGAEITALGAMPAVELLEQTAVVERTVAVQTFGLTHWADAGTERTRSRIAAWCRARRFDCILDPSHAPLGARLALCAAGIPTLDTGEHLTVNGWGDVRGQELLSRAAAAAWGVLLGGTERPVLPLQEDELRAGRRLKEELAGRAPLFALAPIASSPLKRGSVSEFARAADGLIDATNGHVALFAGDQPRQCEAVASVMRNAGRAWRLAPMHLRATAALLAQCRALVCNDTGLMHLAAAVGTPVVAVFACTSPRLYLPAGATAIQRWPEPCRYGEAAQGGFGPTPCVAQGVCLDPSHRRSESWADAAMAAALGAAAAVNGSAVRR